MTPKGFETWIDYEPSEPSLKRIGHKPCFQYEGEVILRRDVRKYFDDTFFSAYKIYQLTKDLGCSKGQGWANELYETMRIYQIFRQEENRLDKREIKKNQPRTQSITSLR